MVRGGRRGPAVGARRADGAGRRRVRGPRRDVPRGRRRGHAEALTRRLAFESVSSGAEATYLLADPEGDAVRIYERIGFERVAHLASWVSPIGRRASAG